MTKREIAYLLKRIPQIECGVKTQKKEIAFYVGNRKEEIKLVEEVCLVFNIVKEVISNESKDAAMIGRLIFQKGWPDHGIMKQVCMSATMYYRIKKLIYGKIYNCCIAKGLVTYEEILAEQII